MFATKRCSCAFRNASVALAMPRALSRNTQRKRVLKASAALCPYSTLGVSVTADEHEIKKAYRRLALQYHPDTSNLPDAEIRFVTIQQAYEILTGKARGKEVFDKQKPDGWDFHDWYWQFRKSRGWESQKHGKPSSGDASGSANVRTNAHTKEALQTQLAGLRHRAAMRATRQQNETCFSEDAEKTSASVATADAEPEVWVNGDLGDGVHVSGAQTSESGKKFVPQSHTVSIQQQLAGLKRKSHIRQNA